MSDQEYERFMTALGKVLPSFKWADFFCAVDDQEYCSFHTPDWDVLQAHIESVHPMEDDES